MSFIIKGIDMPEKENQMYMMELYSDGHCSVAKIEDGECYELTIPSETEAIQIDRPHGRLVDISEIQMHPIYGTADTEYDAPTILEAEE